MSEPYPIGARAARSPGGRVRPLRPLDRAALGRIGAASFSTFGDYEAAVYRWLREPRIRTQVAQAEGGALVGFSMVVIAPIVDGFHPAELLAIAVDPAQRSARWGRRLLSASLAELSRLQRRWPTRWLSLTVADDNAPARALFRSCGFEDVEGEGAMSYAGGQAGRRMRLRIDRPRGAGSSSPLGV